MENSRRSFIKKSAIGAAGLLLGGKGFSISSYERIIGANDRIHVAIIGLGRRLGAFYEPIALKSSNVRLLYLCDVMKHQRDNAATSFANHIDYRVKLENDIHKVLDDPDVDAIFNATPDHWHAPGTIMGVQAGKHVYVEKPGSHNAREGELLAEAYPKYGKVIQLGNQQRSAPESIEIVNQIHDGVIGVPYKAVSFYTNSRGETPVATEHLFRMGWTGNCGKDRHHVRSINTIHGITTGIGMAGLTELLKWETMPSMNWILPVGRCR
jgi:hypothetical protein